MKLLLFTSNTGIDFTVKRLFFGMKAEDGATNGGCEAVAIWSGCVDGFIVPTAAEMTISLSNGLLWTTGLHVFVFVGADPACCDCAALLLGIDEEGINCLLLWLLITVPAVLARIWAGLSP